MKLKTILASFFLVIIISLGLIFKQVQSNKVILFKEHPILSLEELNNSIKLAQTYYEGLYQNLSSEEAIVNEYYPKISYTVRHATIGGFYYYQYINDINKATQLNNFITKYEFDKNIDEHSFIWRTKLDKQENIGFSKKSYQDCNVVLPTVEGITPYHSKVCKLGKIGINLYILATRFDPFIPLVNSLQDTALGKKIYVKTNFNFKNTYNKLGFGMPICTPLKCSSVASTLRTAQFGELELRLKNMKYANSVAYHLVKAQNEEGAYYLSYDKDHNLKINKPFIYQVLDFILNDKPAYYGYIPTNAETMNDVLAFLLHYRCEKYNIGCPIEFTNQ